MDFLKQVALYVFLEHKVFISDRISLQSSQHPFVLPTRNNPRLHEDDGIIFLPTPLSGMSQQVEMSHILYAKANAESLGYG